MKKPFVNWTALEELVRPPLPPKDAPRPKGAPGRGIGGWDNQAPFYNKIAAMEKEGTLNQINCFEAGAEDTFLDVCCGPGRISVPMAGRVRKVTSLDASPKMLEYCRRNADAAGVTNLETVLMDWEDEEACSRLPMHDIVLASRSLGLHDVDRLCRLARKWVVIVIWSYGWPSIPEVTGKLFQGAQYEDRMPFGPHFPKRDRRLGNNLWYNKIYDQGYEPNLKVVADGFRKEYGSREEAYDDLRQLGRDLDPAKDDVFKANVDKFLREDGDGKVTYEAKTRSLVMWWKPEKCE
ncbi:MAG: class I SAM-dependent methyltransferase [Anaerovoracaceae bacterium]|jgi:SAM-dependent methyltransferase